MKFVDLDRQHELIAENVRTRIDTVLNHRQFVSGPEVDELERKLAEFVGVKHCIGVSSGTDALQIAMMALGIGPGDEVITTPFTFIATVETIVLVGATPVFVDIDPKTFNLDSSRLEQAVSPRTKAIMPVSLYGQCADLDAINRVAQKHGLYVIEDAAQSFGATYKERRSCSLSDIGCTSFFPAKPLGCYGDGGACFTDDSALAEAMREIRVHGQSARYVHKRIGLTGRLDTIQAAVLLAKLEIFEQEIAARQRVAQRYGELLGNEASENLSLPHVEPHNTSAWAQYTITVAERDNVAERLSTDGVPTAVHYPVPLHQQEAYRKYACSQVNKYPNAEYSASSVLCLPVHPYLSEQELQEVAAALIRATSGER